MDKQIAFPFFVFLVVLCSCGCIQETFRDQALSEDIFPGASGDSWCDTDFAKRIDVNVNNTAGSALTDYQVYVDLTSNPINETSLRIYNTTSCTLRSHWSENTTGGNSYGIWINYSSIAASTWTNNTAIYYNNVAASSTSDGTTVFVKFEGFETSSGLLQYWVTGKVGNAFKFTTSDDWVNCGNSTEINKLGSGNFSIDAWIKQDAAPVVAADVMFKGDADISWWSYTTRGAADNESLWLQMDGGTPVHGTEGSSDVADSNWHHVVVVMEKNATGWIGRIYINNELEDTRFNSIGFVNGSYPLVFGKCTYGGDPEAGSCYAYDEYLDELHIYNRTLNATETSWSFARGSVGLASNVSAIGQVGYWAFDESSGANVSDSSGEGNHGTLRACLSANWTVNAGTLSRNTLHPYTGTYCGWWHGSCAATKEGIFYDFGSQSGDFILEYVQYHTSVHDAGFGDIFGTSDSATPSNWGLSVLWNYRGKLYNDGVPVNKIIDPYSHNRFYRFKETHFPSMDQYDLAVMHNLTIDYSQTGIGYENSGTPRYFKDVDVYSGAETVDVYLDNIRIRKYTSPEPDTSLGSEEDQSATTPSISNVLNGSISPTSQYIDWDVNQTTHNRVVYSNESDLTPAWYSSWDNSTALPNITLSGLTASTQYWYQAWSYNTTNNLLSDNSSTLSFTAAAVDTSFTVTLPSGYTYLRFEPTNATATNVTPNGQTDLQEFYNVTNTGDVNLDVRLQLNETVANIILKADSDSNSVGAKEVNTTLVTIHSNLATANSADIWLWSDFNYAVQQDTNKTISINVTQSP